MNTVTYADIISDMKTCPHIMTAADLAKAYGVALTTAFRTKLAIAVATGQVRQVPFYTVAGRLAWGYCAPEVQPMLPGFDEN